MQFALDNGTTAQLQICSSARNVSLLPVHRENYKKIMALYVCSKDRICGSMYFNYVFCNAQNLTRVLFCEGLFCNLLRSAIM